MDFEIPASTPVEVLQQQREKREERRAAERARDSHRKLKEKGRESRTSYGRALMSQYAETIGVALDGLLSELLTNEEKPGPFFAYWPLLLHFSGAGPRPIAAIVLGVVIDGISSTPLRSKLAALIGRALQDELKATRIQKGKGHLLLIHLRKRFGRRAVQDYVMRRLCLDPSGWTLQDRRGVGNLLLELIAANTDLITFRKEKKEVVAATDAALALIRENPPVPLPVRTLPSLLPPEPWAGPTRDGRDLVGSRNAIDRSHLTADSLRTAIEVVNIVEQQQVVIDPWMVAVQREAWDCDLPGAFPVTREPTSHWEMPEIPAKRGRIEESIRQGEEVCGRPLWLKHDLDFRGRLYCSSRLGGHQGPDHQKGLLSFRHGERMDDDAFDQLLMAAAGHYGLGSTSWGHRVVWGRDHLQQMVAIAENPLDRYDLWKGASDPWQYLQACKAVGDYMADNSASIGCPVRFDQTASGMGIIGALTRDAALCRHTNVIGSTRSDLYAHIAERVQNRLRMDLDSFDPVEVRGAEFWLKHTIDRSLAKGPTMSMSYGSRSFGVVERLVVWLQEKNPDAPVERWEWEYTRPARYMAAKFKEVLEEELASCLAMEKWLKEVSRRCVKKQKRVQWTTPLGFPISLGSYLEASLKTYTRIHGNRSWVHCDNEVKAGELSARATNRGVTANTIHAFDGALVHAMVLRAAMVGAPLLTNHDCFASLPSRATWLHRELQQQLRQLYLTDWLPEMRKEIGKNAGVALPHPPRVGDLREGAIGENPYCFC